MRKTNYWILIIVLSLGLFFQSCSEDNSLVDHSNTDLVEEQLDFSLLTLRGGHGNRPENGNDRAGTPVAELNNDILESWTELLMELDRYSTGMRPNATARAIAYIYLTAYETGVPGMDDFNSNENRFEDLNIPRNRDFRDVQWELAINTSMARSIDHFILNIPSDLRKKINLLKSQNESVLSQNLSSRERRESKDWGEQVAKSIIAFSKTDAAAEVQIQEPQPLSYEPPTGDGYWTYSADPERALFPYWKSVRTFAIAPEQTTTVAPIPYSENPNSPYYQQMLEVLEVNNEAKVTQGEQLHIAEFWSDDVEGLMMSPPMRQVSILSQLGNQYEINLQDAIVTFLKLGFSLNDAAVATWKYKYDYMVMRPSNYIHEFIDPDFQTNLYRLIYWPNPSFPGYPSGHSCFASAAAGIFIDYFGEQVDFVDRTHEGRTEFLGSPRSFTNFREMADENGYSRIPLGVHIKMDCTEGLRLGYEIAAAVNQLNLSEGN